MICPECKRPTARMIYDSRGKRCPECNGPSYLRLLESPLPTFQPPDFSKFHIAFPLFRFERGEKNVTHTAPADRPPAMNPWRKFVRLLARHELAAAESERRKLDERVDELVKTLNNAEALYTRFQSALHKIATLPVNTPASEMAYDELRLTGRIEKMNRRRMIHGVTLQSFLHAEKERLRILDVLSKTSP